jgi:phosphoenolpyruvate synthase/pyruvate phosphate dikinase
VTTSPHIVWSRDGRGFTTTPAAYRDLVEIARLRPVLETQLHQLRAGADIVKVGAAIRTAFFYAEVPPELVRAVEDAYRQLGGDAVELVVIGVPMDEPHDEYLTGRQERILHVKGTHSLLSACKRCWASLFSDRAIMYREVRGIDHLLADQSVSVAAMAPQSTAGIGLPRNPSATSQGRRSGVV